MQGVLPISVLTIVCLGSACIAGAETPQEGSLQQQSRDGIQSGPYCGVYCVYACLDMFGKGLELTNLLEPEYVGSPLGSTKEELVRAVRDHGAYAVAVDGLTVESLRHSAHPLILHVKDGRRGRKYTHWLLYLGVQDGKARVLDPPHTLELVSFAELLSRWGGTGILVTEQPQHHVLTTWVVWRDLLILSALIASAVVSVGIVARRMATGAVRRIRPGMSMSIQCATLVVSSIIVGVCYHAVAETGFWLNRRAVRHVQRRYYSTFLPKLTAGQVVRLLRRKDVVLVDARKRRDYQNGHIRGAVSIPVNASDSERAQLLRSVPRTKQIVVYCQSSGCTYAQEVADALLVDGYKRISLYPGGWQEWKQQPDAHAK